MRATIIGLPASGKTALLNAVTGAEEPVGTYIPLPPKILDVKVPDSRLGFLKEMFQPQKCTPSDVEFVEVNGLFSSGTATAHDAQLFATVREADLLIKVLRHFDDPQVPHQKGSINPLRDLNDINTELMLADLDLVERRIKKLRVSVTKPTPEQGQEKIELAALERCHEALDSGAGLEAVTLDGREEPLLRGFRFLTQKPVLHVLNVGEGQSAPEAIVQALPGTALEVSAEIEMEIAQLAPEERAEFLQEMQIERPVAERLLPAALSAAGLITFFTVKGPEVRAWLLADGAPAVEAAGKIHSDLERGFIRAEVVHFDDLQALGSVKEARAKGRARVEGKEYRVQDGDILDIRFNV